MDIVTSVVHRIGWLALLLTIDFLDVFLTLWSPWPVVSNVATLAMVLLRGLAVVGLWVRLQKAMSTTIVTMSIRQDQRTKPIPLANGFVPQFEGVFTA